MNIINSAQWKSQISATGFALVIGSGGYLVPYQFQATNDISNFAPAKLSRAQTQKETTFFENVRFLSNEFDMGKDQLAFTLGVSRPTIYSWLKKEPTIIRFGNKAKVHQLKTFLETTTESRNRRLLGSLLRRSLDPEVVEIRESLRFLHSSSNDLEALGQKLRFKLVGLERSRELDSQLG